MEDLKASLARIASRARNPHIHSDLHSLVDEVRVQFGETAKKGVGSFAFYLGFFKRLGTDQARRILKEVAESSATDPKRLFWWKVKQALNPPADSSEGHE